MSREAIIALVKTIACFALFFVLITLGVYSPEAVITMGVLTIVGFLGAIVFGAFYNYEVIKSERKKNDE